MSWDRPRVGIIRGAVAKPAASMDTDLRHHQPGLRPDPQLLAAWREEGRAEGFDAGYAEGLKAARADLAAREAARQEQLSHAVAVLLQATGAFQARETTALQHVADQATRLGFGIAETVIGRELAVAADPGHAAVARALALAPEQGALSIRLHPDDAASLSGLADLVGDREVDVVADPSVQPGGCVLSSGATQVDAQIDTALERVREILR